MTKIPVTDGVDISEGLPSRYAFNGDTVGEILGERLVEKMLAYGDMEIDPTNPNMFDARAYAIKSLFPGREVDVRAIDSLVSVTGDFALGHEALSALIQDEETRLSD